MSEGGKLIIVAMVFVIPVVAIILKTDIGQAIADAIRHNSGANQGAGVRRELEQMRADLEQLRAELEGVHGELAETHDRLDFAERLLATQHDAARPGLTP